MPLQSVIMDNFFHYYQPIYDIQEWKIVGYEGLFRTEKFVNPEIAFQRAKKKKMLYELDSRSIHKASVTYINAGYGSRYERLFLNVFPSTLVNPAFNTLINQIIDQNSLSSQQIIFEIVESETMDFKSLKKMIFKLKDLGFRFAIDDFGKGSSTIESTIELNPDFLKLDRYFIEDLTVSVQKQAAVESILQYCEKFDIALIAEGVEDKRSLALLKSIGIPYAQGYFLGRPALLP